MATSRRLLFASAASLLAADAGGDLQIPRPVEEHSYAERFVFSETKRLVMALNVLPAKEAAAAEVESMNRYMFNDYVSQRTPLNRPVPDTRPYVCASVQRLPLPPTMNVSVVLAVYNEAPSVVLRTIISVLQRTPAALLHEVIVSDDGSTNEDLVVGGRFERFIELLPRVQMVRSPERTGLQGARALGASAARGTVVVFLDCHCEVNVDWIEPLLEPIVANRLAVTMPTIDSIDPQTLVYSGHPLSVHTGGLTWLMNMRWHTASGAAQTSGRPLRSTTMAGGLFAIDRQWWLELGAYDPGLRVWGGENMELAFKVWMCGGEILLSPCSKVGHIFRERQHYPNTHYLENLRRVADVWLDGEYLLSWYRNRPSALTVPVGDLSAQHALRQRLRDTRHCMDFGAFLRAVEPTFPRPQVAKRHGRIMNAASRRCLDFRQNTEVDGDTMALTPCESVSDHMYWWHMPNEELQGVLMCLDATAGTAGTTLKHYHCHNQGGSQRFVYDERTEQLAANGGDMCVTAVPESGASGGVGGGGGHRSGHRPQLMPCATEDGELAALQRWRFVLPDEVVPTFADNIAPYAAVHRGRH